MFHRSSRHTQKQDKMNYGCYASLPWTRPNRANPTGNWFLEPLIVWGQMVGPGWTWYHVEEYVALVCEFLERKRYRFITCISTLNCLHTYYSNYIINLLTFTLLLPRTNLTKTQTVRQILRVWPFSESLMDGACNWSNIGVWGTRDSWAQREGKLH